MELAEARALVTDKTDKEITVRHLISVEGVMRALARRFGEDQDRWALVGLFHDLDQDRTGEDSSRHAYLAAEWLREAGVEEPVVNAVVAHAYEQYRTDLMSKAVVQADAIAGLLVAAALVRPERSAGMKVSSVKKKLKNKAFAPGVNRDEVYGAEELVGLPLDQFIAVRSSASSRSRRRSICRPQLVREHAMAEEHTNPAITEGPHQPLLGLGVWQAPRRADQQGRRLGARGRTQEGQAT